MGEEYDRGAGAWPSPRCVGAGGCVHGRRRAEGVALQEHLRAQFPKHIPRNVDALPADFDRDHVAPVWRCVILILRAARGGTASSSSTPRRTHAEYTMILWHFAHFAAYCLPGSASRIEESPNSGNFRESLYIQRGQYNTRRSEASLSMRGHPHGVRLRMYA